MSSPLPFRAPSRSARPRPRRLAPALVAASALSLSLLVVPAGALADETAGRGGAARSDAGRSAAGSSAAGRSDVTMVQANLPMRLAPENFQSDLRTVFAAEPDFITYNEVERRYDSVIAPGSYDVFRDPTNRYTAATAVAWDTERWTAVASGTTRVSNYRKVPPGWHGLLGLRFANWVTVESVDGRRVSVVSAHLAPIARDMPDLLRPSVTRLGGLVEDLAPQGPVLVGGDFNVHYTSGRYPRDLFDAAQMEPTYDTLGNHFSTGDHFGATIDYLFNRGGGQLVADRHSKQELKSDHDAVIGGFSWQEDLPSETTTVVSDPSAEGEPRRRAVLGLLRMVRDLEAGQQLDLVTAALSLRGVYQELRGAVARGVVLRLTTRSKELTAREGRLSTAVGARGASGSTVQRCRESCLKAVRRAGMPRTLAVVRNEAGRPLARVDLNRNLNAAMLQRRTTVVTRTGQVGLAAGVRLLGTVD